MKRIIATLTGVLALAAGTNAAIVIDEPFAYADGPLTTVSSGVWSNHSGSTLQVDVQSGVLNLTENESEDVNRGLPSGPYGTNGYLYASFTVNFSGLPSGTGGYFAHFKDFGTMNFKGRVFATSTGAAGGTYRLGVANGGNTSTNIPFDLALSSTYAVVLRWNTTNATSTLWVNPTSEASTVNRGDATDSTGNVPISCFALRQSLSSGNGMGTLKLDNLKIGTAFSDVFTAGNSATNPPVVSAIGNQTTPMNTATPPIAFTVNDGETPASNLVVAAVSSNLSLLPNANITFGGSGTDRTITLTPALNQQGSAVITVTVTDGDGNHTTHSFTLVVGAPAISAVPNQLAKMNGATDTIPFTVWDAETAPGSLAVSAWSSNPALVPVANIVFGGSGSNRTAVITPAAGQHGFVYVSFIVNDGTSSASNQFVLTVYPTVPLDIDEPFAYADGLLSDVAGASMWAWGVYSPSPASNDCRVVNGRLLLSQTNADDVRAFIGYGDLDGNYYYSTNGGYLVYYSLTMNMATLPSTTGSYFAFLKDNGTFNFRARLFASTNGAAPGRYRIGIATGSATTTTFIASDLTLNSTYTVTVRYNVSTGDTRLWLNTTSESGTGLDAIDWVPVVDISNFAFRQSAGVGDVFVDNLKVGTGFLDVYQAPNWPPTISTIPDQITAYQTATPAIPFTVADTETAASALTVTVTSSNAVLVPTGNVALGGSGSSRTVKVTPVAGQFGTTLITLTVTDGGGNVASTSFLVTVLGLNNPPVISSPGNQFAIAGTATAALPFTVGDIETAATSLTVGGFSGNTALVPNANIVFAGSGSNRTVTITPAAGLFGSAVISLTVKDDYFTTTNTFVLYVNLGLILADSFSYADGSITTNSAFFWTNNSGVAGDALVQGGKLLLSGSRFEDLKAGLTNAPYYPSNSPPLYAGMTVNFSALPTSTYFTHFTDTGNSFKARVFATLSNAAPGMFRIGIANAAATLIASNNPPFPVDLYLGVPYRLIYRYNPGTGLSSLWINATNEAGMSVTATDAASTGTITNFSFRQNTGIGALTVDDLLVGTAFDVVKGQIPTFSDPSLSIGRSSNVVSVLWPNAAAAAGYILETKSVLVPAGGWQQPNLPVQMQGANSLVSITNPAGNAYFRLRK